MTYTVSSGTLNLTQLNSTTMPVHCVCNLPIVYGMRIPDLDMLLPVVNCWLISTRRVDRLENIAFLNSTHAIFSLIVSSLLK